MESLYTNIKKTINRLPHNTAIYFQGKKISFTKFDRLIDKTADVLVNVLGIKQNDVIMVSQPNIPNVLVLIYALNKIGATVDLVHPLTPFNQIKSIINSTNAKYAFLFEQRVAKEVDRYRDLSSKIIVTRVEDYLPLFKKIIYHFLNKNIRKKLGRYRGDFFGFKYLYQLKKTGKPFYIKQPQDGKVSILLHSGSTTGDPKTICLSDDNFNFIANKATSLTCTDSKSFDKKMFISILPSFHGFGFCMTMHLPLVNGSGVALVSKFSTKDINTIFKKNKIFVMCGVPTMFENLLKDDKFIHNKRLKYLALCFSGGDTMSIALKERFNKVLKDNGSIGALYEGYGLTEAVAANICNTTLNHKDGSLGKPIEGVDVKIVDESGVEVKNGTIGEIILKTPAMMVEYLNNKEGTKEAIRDGYLYSGDLGYKDEDGFIFFSQRKKRVVKVSGVGVFPSEVERLVESIPGVSKCCAIEIPDEKLLHALKVFVVANYYDEEGMKHQIMDTCRKYLIRWSVPKEIEFVDSLPTTLLGKVDFKTIQENENKKRGIK